MDLKIIIIFLITFISFGLVNSLNIVEAIEEPTFVISGGEVKGHTIDPDSKSIIIEILPTLNGELTVKLPRSLIDAKTESGDDDVFFVVVGNQELLIETVFKEVKSETHRTLIIPFQYGNTEIEIFGTQVSQPVQVTNTKEQQIQIIDIIPSKIEGKYLVIFKICAGNQSLLTPEIRTVTDKDSTELSVLSNIGAGACLEYDVTIQAQDPASIRIEFVDLGKAEVKSLKEEIELLKEELVKKDAVLMEQLRVISDLANMLKNAIFETISTYFSFV